MTILVTVQADGAEGIPTESTAKQSKRKGMFDCVHYYKDAMLGRFYAICNCCSCCCGAITVDNGYAVVDYETCMGCSVCVSQCSQDAISLLRDPAKGEPLEIKRLIAHAARLTQASSTAFSASAEFRFLASSASRPLAASANR